MFLFNIFLILYCTLLKKNHLLVKITPAFFVTHDLTELCKMFEIFIGTWWTRFNGRLLLLIPISKF